MAQTEEKTRMDEKKIKSASKKIRMAAACAYTGFSKETLNYAAKTGMITYYQIGAFGHYWFTIPDLDKFMESCTKQSA